MKKGWKVEKLGDVCEVFADGDWIESKDQSSKGIRLIQTGNVGEGIFKNRGEKARYISEETFKRLRCTEIFEGDCLISRLPDPVGRACILPNTGERMITAVDCTIVRFKKTKIVPEFFNYYSQSIQYLKDVDHETTGTTRKRISRSKLGEVEIPIPPLPEQQRIVTLLDETFAGLAQVHANAERNLVNAREVFEAEADYIFMTLSNKWEEKRLDEIYDVRDGTHYSPKFYETGYPFVTSKNLKNGKLNFDKIQYISEKDYNEYNKRSKVDKGDILFAMIGTLGNPVVVEVEPDFAIKNVALIKVPTTQSNYFLKYYLDSKSVVEKFYKNANGTTQKFVGLGNLRKFTIPLPPLEEQRAIVQRLDGLAAETSRLEAVYQSKLEAVEELRKSVLKEAFEGRL